VLLSERERKAHDIFVDGVVLAGRSLVHEVVRCTVDAEHQVLLERPGRYITRELGVSGLIAAAKTSQFKGQYSERTSRTKEAACSRIRRRIDGRRQPR
jgi:hypothetical protein